MDETETIPTQTRVNISALIRQTWDAKPKLKPAQISAMMRKRGYTEITPSYVATVLSAYRKKKGLKAISSDGELKPDKPIILPGTPMHDHWVKNVAKGVVLALQLKDLVGIEMAREIVDLVADADVAV